MLATAQMAAIDRLATFPRVSFGTFPTPIEDMPRLREALGRRAPRLFIKRDDYSGLGFGGNKVRTLEYVFGRLRADGVQAVVTVGGDRSNHARVTAFACVKTGIQCILVLDKKPRPIASREMKPASIYLSEMLGAEIHLTDNIPDRLAKAVFLTSALENEGVVVRMMPLGGALPEGALGFVNAMGEIRDQERELGLSFDRIHFASSGAGTHTGMLVGSRIFGFDNVKLNGIAPEPESDQIRLDISRFAAQTESILGIGETDYKIDIDDLYAGKSYCEETTEAKEAIKLVARMEGIILDPVYTGKAMAALIDRIRKGEIAKDENILFWHTGGQHTMFYAPV